MAKLYCSLHYTTFDYHGTTWQSDGVRKNAIFDEK